MATKWAITNGNWSNGSTWNDGVVPTADDDVYTNGYVVNLDIAIIEAKKITNNICENTGNGGGYFQRSISNFQTINADLVGNGTNLLIMTRNYYGWAINGNCFQENNTSPLIIGGASVYIVGYFLINGNCVGYVLSAGLYTHYSGSYGHITFNGNYNGHISIGEESSGNPYETIAPIIFNGIAEFDGSMITLTSTGKVQFMSDVIDNGSQIRSGVIEINKDLTLHNFPICYGIITNGHNVNIIKESDNLSLTTMYDECLPQEQSVSQGVIYGMQNEYEGRLQLPPEGAVLKDVTYGDKTGTLEVIALTGATATADNISVVNLTEQQLQRVGNCATVSTVQKCFEDFKE